MSLDWYLRVLEPQLGSAIVDRDAMTGLHAIARHLPPFSQSILEVRLGDGVSQADLSLQLPRMMPEFSSALLDDPLWSHAHATTTEWNREGTPAHRFVREMWLEFDGRASSVDRPPSPNLFFGFDRNPGVPGALPTLAHALTGQERSAAEVRALASVIGAFPPRAWLAHLGAMLARNARSLRLVIADIAGDCFADVLAATGWHDAENGLNVLMRHLAAYADEFYLDVDVDSAVAARISIECFLKREPLAGDRWRRLLADLCERGLCTPAKADALMGWPGVTQRSTCADLWPENLRWTDDLIGVVARSFFLREISHIKIVYEPGRLVEAKAYLRFRHIWAAPDSAGYEKKNV